MNMNTVNFREVEAIVANAPVGVLVTRNRLIARYNRKFSEMFGFVGEAGVGQAASILYPSPEAYDALGALAVPLLSVGKPLQTELSMRRQDGTVFWVELSGYVLNTEYAAEGTVWFLEDRSAWQAAQTALQQALLENEAILDNAQAGIAVIENRRIVRCNRRMDEIFAYPPGGLSGRSTRVFYISTQEFEAAGAEIYRVLGECGVYSGEINMRCMDGRSLWCHVGARALDLTDPLGKSIWIFDDISARKASEKALAEAKAKAEAAAEAKSMFLANMSHEIRTPMNAIIGLSHLAQKTELTARQRDYVQKIHSAGTALLGIINDILDFSKIEAGQIDLECIDFCLDDVLDNVAVVVGQRAQDKGLELVFDLPSGVSRFLRGDRLRLSQVLTNLVSNAVKFTEAGNITVAIEQRDSVGAKVKLQFEIRDTGIGMSEAQMLRLFQPFSQADGSTTRKYGGTGLGLSICKRLVELMGGEIGVTSAPGKGSTFSFSARFERGDGAVGKKRKVLPSHLDGMRVLVADDNAAARDVLLRLLESFGLHVDAVASGHAAVAAVAAAGAKDPYRVAFIDWRMPGLDGIDTVQSIRMDPGLEAPPLFVLVSAFSREDVRVRAEQNGIDLFLVKPVSPSALEDTLVTLFPPADGEIAGDIARGFQPTPPELKHLRVLLAEDNEINQQIAVELLESAGATVDVVGNGREAVDRLMQGGSYDVVLMDLQMPVMGGHEATRLIRAEPRFASLPILALTAHAMAEERQHCFDSGMNEHLLKPIDPDALFRTLARYGACCHAEAAAAAPQADPLFALPGLDTAAGLRRTGGKADFYRKLLHQFLHTQSGAVRDIHIALAATNFRLAARLAHTLKGVAGNIGALALSQIAAEVDDAIREKPGGEVVKSCLMRLDFALNDLCTGLAAALGRAEVAGMASAGARVSPDRMVETLTAALQRNDGEVADYFDAHAEALREILPSSDFAALASAVRNYDFAAALARLAALPDRCQSAKVGSES
ncbi:MAG: response regulator [Rhodocyclales bacterium]|nr:response regulator [Rhodocyclales bacterium]